MAMLRVLLHAAPEALDAPAAVLLDANRRLAANIPPGQFVTACYAVLEPRTGMLDFALAGHEPPLVAHLDSDTINALPAAGGPPMGPFPDARFEGARIALAPGDTVLFSTDGLSEAMNSHSELFGHERVCALLRAERAAPAEAVRDRLVEAVDRHGLGLERADDLTLLVLRREPAPVPALAAAAHAL
jgi:sigma-B regulation protein RsbU (phosphoserine phosphatase)